MSPILKYVLKEVGITLLLIVLVFFASRATFRARNFQSLDDALDDSLTETYHQIRRRLSWLKFGLFAFSWCCFIGLSSLLWLKTAAPDPKALLHVVELDDFSSFLFLSLIMNFPVTLGFLLGVQPMLVQQALLPHAQKGADLKGFHRYYQNYLRSRNPKISNQNLVMKMFNYNYYPAFAVFGWIFFAGIGYLTFTVVAGHTTFYSDHLVHFGMSESTIPYSELRQITVSHYTSDAGPMTRIQAIGPANEVLYRFSFSKAHHSLALQIVEILERQTGLKSQLIAPETPEKSGS